MKRKILTSILGVTAALAATSAHATGTIYLDSYTFSGSVITYGGGPNQISGTVAGNGVLNGTPYNGSAGNITWTINLYYALGNVTGSVASDPTGVGDPSTLGGGLTLLTGAPGDSSKILQIVAPVEGYFGNNNPLISESPAIINGYSSGPVTFEVVAYSGSTYDSSLYRGHSAAFALTPATGSEAIPYISSSYNGVYYGMPTFSVYEVPEPSAFALTGIATATLLLVRRRK